MQFLFPNALSVSSENFNMWIFTNTSLQKEKRGTTLCIITFCIIFLSQSSKQFQTLNLKNLCILDIKISPDLL